jgi:protoporphyrinogen oxidase
MQGDILIVGAGLAGVFAAYNLSLKGYNVMLVEKSRNIGGLLRTIRYVDSKGCEYFFDIGPHIPPNSEIWGNLCREVETVKLQPSSLKSSMKLENFEISYPINLKNIISVPSTLSLKLFKSYLESLIVKRNEISVEDLLINKFGITFYQDYLKNYLYKFWKIPPSLISTDFDIRIPSVSLKNLIRSLMLMHAHYSAKTSGSDYILYPAYGIGQVIKPMVNKIIDHSNELKLGTTVRRISFLGGKIFVSLKEPNSTTEHSFNNIVWTGSLRDLVELLGLISYGKKLNYRKLLIVNCAIEREVLLSKGIIDSYVMSPEIIFHRIYEPKKFSLKMVPPSQTSVSIETTITGYMENDLPLLVEKIIKQFQYLYNLASSEIRYLGYEIIDNAYPILTINYKRQVDEIARLLQKKNLYLLGRTGHYEYVGIQKILEDTVQIVEKLSRK